jgi:hypothetical protein
VNSNVRAVYLVGPAETGRRRQDAKRLENQSILDLLVRETFEEELVLGAIGFGPRSFCLGKYLVGLR